MPELPSVLPFELERQIFELAARNRPVSIPTLMQVAWRVKTWVEPMLYRTMVVLNSYKLPADGHLSVDKDTFVNLTRTKAAELLTVQNLLLDYVGDEKSILRACPAVKHLWMRRDLHSERSDSSNLLSLLGELPLSRLHCNIATLFRPLTSLPQIDFTHPVFAHITHLEITDSFFGETWMGLALVPNLTHLAFSRMHSIGLWLPLLRVCTSLRALVVLTSSHNRLVGHQDEQKLAMDPRFVVMEIQYLVADWQVGAHGGADYWTRAETFIAKRRAREIDPLMYKIDEDASGDSV
ncbi:hypothetical protein C8R43DRAFT_1132526 [Mycena crocata]|nr:hypothetical protein C8R43DRAFT_1132526 [Mycena crocata]